MTVDARIQQSVVANLSARPAPVAVGPFVIGIDPGTDSPHINYATPRPGVSITRADVSALMAAFREASRKPRLEYVPSTAPGLERLLLDAGFTVEERHDYLVCLPGTLSVPPVPEGFRLLLPDSTEQRMAMVSAQNEAFGGSPTASESDAVSIERLQDRGGIAIMATDEKGLSGTNEPGSTIHSGSTDSRCAGGGQAVPPNDGVSEVGGIAVREPYRRRGLAGAITAAVTAQLFAAGADLAWLEASGNDSWRVYERVGYRPAGKRLYLSLN